MAIGNYRACAWAGALLALVAALVAPLATRPPEAPRAILTIEDDEPALWRFIPVDVLPGGAEVETELPSPPPASRLPVPVRRP